MRLPSPKTEANVHLTSLKGVETTLTHSDVVVDIRRVNALPVWGASKDLSIFGEESLKRN